MPFVKGQSGNKKGKAKGTPNKATANARAAIATFIDESAEEAMGWISQIADGVDDKDGNVVEKPDPKGAFDCWQKLLEYHIPKLARTEIKNADDEAFKINVDVTTEVLKHLPQSVLEEIANNQR